MEIFWLRIFLAGLVSFILGLGLLIARFPKRTIELQTAFYRSINWNMTPISMEREIRNTRRMGISLVLLGGLAAAYLLLALGSAPAAFIFHFE